MGLCSNPLRKAAAIMIGEKAAETIAVEHGLQLHDLSDPATLNRFSTIETLDTSLGCQPRFPSLLWPSSGGRCNNVALRVKGGSS